MPELNRLRDAFEKNGVDLIGLNLDAEPEGRVPPFLEKVRVEYPIYIGGVAAIGQLFATDEMTVPLSVVLDPNGRVEQVISGWSAATQRTFEGLASRAR
jgi:hypothetical protein